MQQVAHHQAFPQSTHRPRGGGRRADEVWFCAVPTSLLVLFIVVPLAALVWRAVIDPTLWSSLTKRLVLDALWVTGLTTSATLLIALIAGTPLAYLLARHHFPGKWLVELATDLPLELPFTMTAVVLAQLFVAGSFYIRGAKLGFAAIDPELEEAAAMDGASAWARFWYVILPLALPGITSGIVLCMARAVSEFGATLMFAGNFARRTQTMSLAIMAALETNLSAALALAVLLVGIAAVVLVLSRVVTSRWLDQEVGYPLACPALWITREPPSH